MDFKTFLEHFDTIAQAPNGIAKLRSLILDLAVRGKLVPQNPEDEPAIQSLERMQQEKAEVIQAEGFRTKNLKKSFENNDYEIDFLLPKKWTLAELNVGIQSIQNFIYPLPPLAEQMRIVEKVDEMMQM